MPRVPAAASTSRISEAAEALLDLTMIANRRTRPASSRNNSTRLPAVSAVWLDKPVMFPPGRASDATRPEASGSPDGANHDRDLRCCPLCRNGRRCARREDDIDLRANKLGCDLVEILCGRPPIFDCDGGAVDPAQLAQPLHQSGDPLAVEPGMRSPSVGRLTDGCARVATGHAATAPPSSVM